MPPSKNARPTNIVVMISHDLGCHIGPYGRALAQSPHLTRFAEEGLRFDAHFVSSPGCSQSRSSLMTGRYPHANGQFGLTNWGWKLNEDEVLLPAVLREHGYHTTLFGIWHLHDWTLSAFDTISNDVSTMDRSPEGFAEIASDRAARWLGETGRQRQPFYLHVGFWETHRPFCADAEQEAAADALDASALEIPAYLPDNHPTRREMAELHQSISLVDRGVERILNALTDANLTDDTLVLFTSDHGLPFPRAKGTLYDPGIQVSLLARWPGRIAAGGHCRRLTSNVDVMPTMLEAAGLPAMPRIQGRSFLPMLRDPENAEPAREAIFAEKTYHEHYDPIRCVRTAEFKYIRNFADRPMLVLPSDIYNSPTRKSITDDEAIWSMRPLEELYDLRTDPLETINRIDDPACADAAADLRDRLTQWMRETGDPLLDGPIARSTVAVE